MARTSTTFGAGTIVLPKGHHRLILCFDGSWNNLESSTNVLRLFRSLATVETACPAQLAFYDEGVGTDRRNRFLGGFAGAGLDENVLEGYCWLVNNYKPGHLQEDARDHIEGELTDAERSERFSLGDLIFLVGFSRGAYTARSLASLINRVGLVDRTKVAGWRQGEPVTPESDLVSAAWKLYRDGKDDGSGPQRYQESEKNFREANCHNVKIACVAVWDTVGAMGIPRTAGPLFQRSRDRYAFHDTRLGRVVEHGYHALAIDEHRPDFAPTLWQHDDHEVQWARDVEQRWFPGSHANVGGGYDDDLLCEAPLFWMADKLAALGLVFRRDREDPPTYKAEAPPEFKPSGNDYLSPLRDSYTVFAGGLYPILLRIFGKGGLDRRMLIGTDGIAQSVDPSARLKWDIDPDYRPTNLAMAGRTDTTRPPVSERDLRIAQGHQVAAPSGEGERK
jgi:uncharacterized protein (DUF2235 family)